MCRLFLALVSSLVCVACSHPATAVRGQPQLSSQRCQGDAPVDKEVAQVKGARASWFSIAESSERLYVLEAGEPSRKQPTLVLFHGIGEKGAGDFYPVLEMLSRSRHVLAVDLPGFGRSHTDDEDFGPERLTRSVDAVSRACAGSDKVDVLGHSSGGALALLFAAHRNQDVRRLIIVDAAGILHPEVLLRGQLHEALSDVRETAPVAGEMVEGVGDLLIKVVRSMTPSKSKVAESGLLGSSPSVLAAMQLLDFNFGQAISDIRAPTLILWGEEDRVVPPRIAYLLDDRIEDSAIQFIAGAGHVPMKEQPERFASMVTGYLKPKHVAHDGKQPPNTSAREGRCDKQENIVFEGDYARIDVNACKKVWLKRVRAKQVVVKDSDGRLDNAEVSESLVVEKSEMAITGGTLRGDVALETSDSKLDIAGVRLWGKMAALRVRKESYVVFSVSPLQSPKSDRIFHGEGYYEDGDAL